MTVRQLLIVTAAPFLLLAGLFAYTSAHKAQVTRLREQAQVVARPTTTLFAVGDIMLSRAVGAVVRQKNDVHFPFAFTGDLSSGADIAFGNLETAVTEGPPVADEEMSFRTDPETVTGLADAGYDVVSLANNHSPNFGQAGLLDTFKYLEAAGVAYAGAGSNDAAAHQAAVIERNGTRFAFLAYTDHDIVPETYVASDGHAGTAVMSVERVAKDVAAARLAADVVIVSMHSGIEYSFEPDDSQTAFAHAAIDAGADLVLGHHAHVVQPFESYRGKLLFYGLGNFIFDQSWSLPTQEGLAMRFTFEGNRLVSAEALPVTIGRGGQPRGAEGDASTRVLRRLGIEPSKTEGKYLVPLP